jgi:hypothetical protein
MGGVGWSQSTEVLEFGFFYEDGTGKEKRGVTIKHMELKRMISINNFFLFQYPSRLSKEDLQCKIFRI